MIAVAQHVVKTQRIRHVPIPHAFLDIALFITHAIVEQRRRASLRTFGRAAGLAGALAVAVATVPFASCGVAIIDTSWHFPFPFFFEQNPEQSGREMSSLMARWQTTPHTVAFA